MSSPSQIQPDLPPGRYRHFKGGEYQVLDLAKHSETEEWMVLYRPLYGDQKLWVRPFAMFTEMVTYQNKLVSRFTLVE
ncbi:DUF1653 domain-containing protein [Corallincola platygyrae]|uniref:DUF1653 domain-containing protein n=1 Tax=Corallincola platygyrae TaxID=1193278 RepID=A0ABW4XP18_9GAMM